MTAPRLDDPRLRRSHLRSRDVVGTGAVGLRTRRLRTALTALGIAIGIAALVAVLGISASGQADLLAQLDELGTNRLTVQAGPVVPRATTRSCPRRPRR